MQGSDSAYANSSEREGERVEENSLEVQRKESNRPDGPTESNSEMGAQQSAFHPALSQIIHNQGGAVKEDELENKNLLNKGGEDMSAAAIKSLHHLQMLKVFSNMTEATRQAYLQTQALQKKPYYMSPPPPQAPPAGSFSKEQGNFNKEPIRPYPLTTPDIKTPRCRSTLLPFTGSALEQQQQPHNYPFNGDQEVKIENTHNINAMEEIIKLTEERSGLPSSTPTSTTSSSGANSLPINFLQTDSVIQNALQELIVQRQMKQRRFKDLDCSFVHKLIQQPNLVNNLVNSVPDHKPKIDFNSVLSRLSSSNSESEQKIVTSPPPPSLPPQPPSSTSSETGNIVEELLNSSAAVVGTSASSAGDQARYECPRCARVFAYEYVLQTHMRQVCPDRSNYKHPCTVCKKRFQNQSSLKRHMIVHTGERKYECEVCHKRFGRSHHLKRHVKIHEMEAANYTQHHGGVGGVVPDGQQPGTIPEETLQLILQLGAMNKFPLSPASLIDSAIAEDMMSNCDSIEDGDSQGDIDMEDPVSDAGEVSVDNSADEERMKQTTPHGLPPQTSSLSPTSSTPQSLPVFTSSNALSIQNILNTSTPLFYNSEVKKPVVTLVPPTVSSPPQNNQDVDVITPSCDVITTPRDVITAPRDVTSPIAMPTISLSSETAQPTQ
ncbi:hypothetical protein ACHWQZ_G014103 [Mnemiopsis leidyi]